jgi:hypothetical protein
MKLSPSSMTEATHRGIKTTLKQQLKPQAKCRTPKQSEHEQFATDLGKHFFNLRHTRFPFSFHMFK